MSQERKNNSIPYYKYKHLLVELKTKYSNRVMLTARVIDIYPPNTNIFSIACFRAKIPLAFYLIDWPWWAHGLLHYY